MAEIRFHITADRVQDLTLDEVSALEDMQDGKFEARQARALLAKFTTDDTKNYLSEPDALKLIGALKMRDLRQVFTQFNAAFQEYTLPKANGDN